MRRGGLAKRWARRKRYPRRAQVAAFAAGFLLLVAGSSGAVAAIGFGERLVDASGAKVGWTLGPFFSAAGILAALGGITVLVGAMIIRRQRVIALVLLWLGSGVGVLTLLAGAAALATGGADAATGILSALLSLQGLAMALLFYARWKA